MSFHQQVCLYMKLMALPSSNSKVCVRVYECACWCAYVHPSIYFMWYFRSTSVCVVLYLGVENQHFHLDLIFDFLLYTHLTPSLPQFIISASSIDFLSLFRKAFYFLCIAIFHMHLSLIVCKYKFVSVLWSLYVSWNLGQPLLYFVIL